MLAVFSLIFVVDTKITFVYDFVTAPLKMDKNGSFDLAKNDVKCGKEFYLVRVLQGQNIFSSQSTSHIVPY